MSDLAEQALNKVAEVGIASQLDEVENLDVEIKTDPLKMMSGTVDSVSIKGEGMVMRQDLRVEEMQLDTGSVSINPLGVALGKIELNHPTEAQAQVVLTETDINRAFNSDFIREKMQNLDVQVGDQIATVDTQKINFSLPGDNKILLTTEVVLQATQERKRVAFTAVPTVSSDGQKIVLEDLQYLEGQDLSPTLTNALLQQAKELLNLQNFELEGMSLRLKKLDTQPGQLTLKTEATVQQFPS
jgi:LmeA-like phospholipid-binding